MRQLSLVRSLDAKAEALGKVEINASDWLALARTAATTIATRQGTVCADDLRVLKLLPEPHHPNAWGAVFRGKDWERAGYRKSRLPSNHARVISYWRLAS